MFSSINKLLRIVAYVLRYIHNLGCKKESCKVGKITAVETENAKLAIVKLVQKEEFKEDIKTLKNSNKVQRNSRLIAFHPYIDASGILRVGGRLEHAVLSEEVKYPTLLPALHHFTTLVIMQHHKKLFYAGFQSLRRLSSLITANRYRLFSFFQAHFQTTLSSVRQEFWPIFAKSRVKKVLRNCAKCRKAQPKPSWQLMGKLPPV